jgi:surface antigen
MKKQHQVDLSDFLLDLLSLLRRLSVRKSLNIVILLMVLIIVASMKSVKAQGPNQSGGAWKTYVDSVYGFTLEYPAENWTAEVTLENKWKPEHVIKRRVSFEGPGRALIQLDVWDNPKRSSLREWLILYQERLIIFPVGSAIPKEPNGTISGFPAIALVANGTPQTAVALVSNGKNVFRFDYAALDNFQADDVYFHMLSSTKLEDSDGTSTLPASALPKEKVSPTEVSTLDINCFGAFTDAQGNAYRCNEPGCYHGNCTWWVAYRRQDNLGKTTWGDAVGWYGRADSEGYAVCSRAKDADNSCIPVPGAVAWYSSGHVAYVENGDPFRVSEMNCYERSVNYPAVDPVVWVNQGDLPPMITRSPDGYIYGFRDEPVALFEGKGFYSGGKFRFESPGKYNVPDWLNDKTLSVSVADGWAVKLYEHTNQEGRCLLLDKDSVDLETKSFNGIVSSIEVFYAMCPRPCPETSLSSANMQGTWGICSSTHPPSSIDSAIFLSDATLPDGSTVSPGQALVKMWRVRNSGTTPWDGYQLIFAQGDQMGGNSPVNIATTAPNQEVNIGVPLRAPDTSGSKTGYWQIVNRDGTHIQGGRLRVNVNVVSSTSGGHIAALSADPPSPSSANTVRLYAKVNWWPQFRAMRVRVDGQDIGTAEVEHFFDWDTTNAERGDHTITLEVADQTDTSWSRPERRVMVYTLQGDPAPANHAPNRPNLSSPYDWYVYYSGNTAQLCAQANGDPDGDAIAGYYFDIHDSAELWNSGWVSSNCATTSALGPHDYQWRVKVRDSHGAESEWSDNWHFTLVNPSLSISELYFQPQDGNSEQVKIRACTTGQGGIGITMRVSVNSANDGSGNGTWHIVKELGAPCFNDVDAPNWNTLEYGDGPHLVRVEAHGVNTGWDGAAVREEPYTLPHRRPVSPRLLAPIPPSGTIGEPIYLNSRTITFRWEPVARASGYTLHVSLNPSPQGDSNPIFRGTFGNDVNEYTVTFDQDYPTLYWQVSVSNDAGDNASASQFVGIDRAAPSCVIQALAAATPESTFQVSWSGSDSLAGVRAFDIQFLDSGREAWTDWLTGLPASKAYELFTGEPGHTYSFRCLATDNAGNRGSYPTSADTFTRVDPTTRPPTPWWDSAYGSKHNIIVLNNMGDTALPAGYPVHLHFDSSTTPSASDIYNASRSSQKCNDLRIVYNNTTELARLVQSCNSDTIDIWFRSQVAVSAGSSDNTSHQLYYGNASAGAPPADPNQVWKPARPICTSFRKAAAQLPTTQAAMAGIVRWTHRCNGHLPSLGTDCGSIGPIPAAVAR